MHSLIKETRNMSSFGTLVDMYNTFIRNIWSTWKESICWCTLVQVTYCNGDGRCRFLWDNTYTIQTDGDIWVSLWWSCHDSSLSCSLLHTKLLILADCNKVWWQFSHINHNISNTDRKSHPFLFSQFRCVCPTGDCICNATYI